MVMRALVFTDIVDSTRIVEQLGDARAAHAWADHDRRVRDLLAQHRGREIGRADGWALLQLLCDLGQAEWLAGDRDAARAVLTAARAEAAAMDEDSQAEAQRTIGALRDLLE